MISQADVIAAFAGIAASAVTFAGFWMMLGRRIGKNEDTAETALREAAEATNENKDLRIEIKTLVADFSRYRESALKDFATYQVLAEIERRLAEAQIASEKRQAEAQAAGEKRLIEAIDRLTVQFDRVLTAGLAVAKS